MRLKNYPEREGKRVWLSETELRQLIQTAEGVEQRVAFKLGGESGLRRSEAASEPQRENIVGEPGNWRLRIWEDSSKNDRYRETPLSDELVAEINSIADLNGLDDDESVLQVQPKTLYRWVRSAGDRLHDKTGDVGWSCLDYHDLRRTWGVLMLERGVLPSVVFEWGGWQSWRVFRDSYLSEFSPAALRRERQKVPHLASNNIDIDIDDPQQHMLPVINTTESKN